MGTTSGLTLYIVYGADFLGEAYETIMTLIGHANLRRAPDSPAAEIFARCSCGFGEFL